MRPLFALLQSGQVIDSGVLDHRQEDKDEAEPQINVHSFDVGDSGHGGVHSGDDGGHGEHCCDAFKEIRLISLL